MKSYEWNGHEIQVEFKAMAATGWLGGALIVSVGNRRFCPQLDGFSRKGSTEFFIHDNGNVFHGVVQAIESAKFVFGVRYTVTIEGQEIARDFQVAKGWHLSCLSLIIIFVVLLLATFGGFGLFYAFFLFEEG